MAVTMKDIAMLAGVSQQAVSSALNGNGSSRVAAAKKEKILKLARELNYVPNAAARSLSGGQTKAIGILGAINGGWQNNLNSEICELLISRGYNTLNSHYGVANFCATKSLTELISRGVDGVIILNSQNKKELETNQSVPFVYSSHCHEHGYDVGVDNELTGYIGTRHLLEHGHQRVFYLFPMWQETNHERADGWRRAHEERGISVSDSMMISMRELDGRVDRLLELLHKNKVTAIFAKNDYMAAKVMKCFYERGIRVPEDIALVGCDGYSFVEFCPVSLTTVVQPIRPVAEITVDLLLKRIADKELHAQFAENKISPLLWTGGSCGCRQQPIEQLYRLNTTSSLEKDMKINFNQNIMEVRS
jgi:LacI family transcriptional regulator